MKLVMTCEPPTVEFELKASTVASSHTAGSVSLGYDEHGSLARITIADPTWKELPKVEFEGFPFKTVSFEVKGN